MTPARIKLDTALYEAKTWLRQAVGCIQILLPEGKLGGTDVLDEIRLRQIEDSALAIARQAREAREKIESVRRAA